MIVLSYVAHSAVNWYRHRLSLMRTGSHRPQVEYGPPEVPFREKEFNLIDVTFSQTAASCLQIMQDRRLGDLDASNVVYCLPLELDVGPLQPDVLGPERKATLEQLYAPMALGPDMAEQALETAATALQEIPVRRKDEEDLRIWYSDAPFEACGFMWFMSWLSQLPSQRFLMYVHLPPWFQRPGGPLAMPTSCRELSPEDFAWLTNQQKDVRSLLLPAGLDFEWRQLVAQNAPLRTVLCGRVMSVPQNSYDFLLRQQISVMEDVFPEALLIGNVLGYSQIDVSEGWLALRIEHMIEKGELGVVDVSGEQGEQGAPAFHRTLRKLRTQ